MLLNETIVTIESILDLYRFSLNVYTIIGCGQPITFS